MRKLVGAAIMKISERNYKDRYCELCGKIINNPIPSQKYCRGECQKVAKQRKAKERYQKYKKQKVVHCKKRCAVCGELLDDGRKNVHFECMLERWKNGNRSNNLKRFFYNRGYSLKEINEMIADG